MMASGGAEARRRRWVVLIGAVVVCLFAPALAFWFNYSLASSRGLDLDGALRFAVTSLHAPLTESPVSPDGLLAVVAALAMAAYPVQRRNSALLLSALGFTLWGFLAFAYGVSRG